ncbi:uncharacterized protein LOC127736533 isoform X2 [Mytilus californianus]|uniref:uncharacterized protein LOC127736533 isoform X2 n=1 Tax=Mytilus californianus TaxID=6549 RepID=UPI0022456F3F|nr:uncharacterized protein LOC127736533 isoform X2 [Mytilus californianus]
MYIVNTQKKYDMISPSWTRKGKALIGSAKGRIFKKCSKKKSDQIDSGKRNVYSFTSEDSSPLKAMEGKTEKKSSTSDDRSPLKATDDLNDAIDVCPILEKTSEITGDGEKISETTGQGEKISETTGQGEKISETTGQGEKISETTGQCEKISEITGDSEKIGETTGQGGKISETTENGRKRTSCSSKNEKVDATESKKCTVRLTDIGTIKNLKTYVDKTEKKRKRKKICLKNL